MMLRKTSRMNGERKPEREHFFAGQVVLEFTFCMIIVLLMVYGVAKVFFWTGRDLAQRRQAHDALLFNQSVGSLEQLNPDFYSTITRMNAIWNEN